MRSKEVKNRTEGKKMKEPRLVTLPGTGVQATKDRVHKESSCRARAPGQVSWHSMQQEVEPSSAQAQVVLTRTSVSSFPGVNYSFHAATTGANCSLSSRGNVILCLLPSSLQDAATAPSLSDFPLQQDRTFDIPPKFPTLITALVFLPTIWAFAKSFPPVFWLFPTLRSWATVT